MDDQVSGYEGNLMTINKLFKSPKPVAAIGILAAAIGAAAFVGRKRRLRLPDATDGAGA